ncbi:Alpha/Beta hydrolase protein [Bombardia bombarda]|uniref:Alpha/Beta hydrolase protein n=1 Tax=Bombardia bombarda TaxID=252184 RepID=A0AA40CDZ8_9PEZI|nr:Alpha/Beta hydrolase protein [Bombardia bombarda]
MFDFYLSYKWLHWRRPIDVSLPVLPEGIDRFLVPTPGGNIEILYAKPKAPRSSSEASHLSPIFFVHGGMGGAWVWLEYMSYLSARGIPCFAISLRGHGASWQPSFLRMVYATSKRMLADDLLAGIRWAQEREGGNEVVLVGHSSGGGLSQFVLSNQEVRVKGLALVAAVPGSGSTRVYMNWWFLDPWFTLRMVLHGWHPNSPLSHPALTRRVFFSEKQSDAYVERFQKLICPYESFIWALGMGRPFANPQKLLAQISSTRNTTGQGVLVLCGGADKIMTLPVMETLAGFYRKAYSSLESQKKSDANEHVVEPIPGDGGQDTAGHGVRLCVVPGAGHHLQNDVQWEAGAHKLFEFYEQL